MVVIPIVYFVAIILLIQAIGPVIGKINNTLITPIFRMLAIFLAIPFGAVCIVIANVMLYKSIDKFGLKMFK